MAIGVKNLEAMKTFYIGLLGFKANTLADTLQLYFYIILVEFGEGV